MIKLDTQWLNVVIFKVTIYFMTLYYYEYFNEGVACIIKSCDIIYRKGLECNYIYIVVLNIVNGNFGLVKSWKKSSRPIEASVLLVHFGPTPSHLLKPNWNGPKG